MATTVRELDLSVEGVLPAELDGYILQASIHPADPLGPTDRPPVIAGFRLDGGRAEWYRQARHGRPFGPNLGLTAALPVREARTGRWHTIATNPGMPYAEHIVATEGGTVLGTRRFSLDGAPLIYAVALTGRYVVVLDLPVTYRRAAALIGEGLPYAWQPNRPARIGLLPLDPQAGAAPRWFPVDPCYVFHAVNAYDEGDGTRVVLDAVCHERAFDATPSARPAHVRRWELDLATGRARARRLTGTADLATVDGRVSGRPHRFLFLTTAEQEAEAAVVRQDLATGRTQKRMLAQGLRVGQPVFVPREGGEEGDGWLLVVVEDAVHRRGQLLVLDAADITARPLAIVHFPVCLPVSSAATWQPAV